MRSAEIPFFFYWYETEDETNTVVRTTILSNSRLEPHSRCVRLRDNIYFDCRRVGFSRGQRRWPSYKLRVPRPYRKYV